MNANANANVNVETKRAVRGIANANASEKGQPNAVRRSEQRRSARKE